MLLEITIGIVMVLIVCIVYAYYLLGKAANPYSNNLKVIHVWKFCLTSHDPENHREYKMYRCEACGEYKKEYTGNIYQGVASVPHKWTTSIPHKCQFCDSIETTAYPREDSAFETVYLCEDCKSIGSGESSDR
ncbi:MAG: hypothetical protein AABY22_08555 [Nanoarchaeota archaeon]